MLVHFPSRRTLALKTKVAGIAALRKIHGGENFEGIVVVLTVKKKVLKERARAPHLSVNKSKNMIDHLFEN